MISVKAPATAALVSVNRRAATRLRQGHVWVYRSDVAAEEEPSPGSLVSVADEHGNLIGTATYSGSSQIALRMISTGPVRAEEFPALVRDRILQSLNYRKRLRIPGLARDSNNAEGNADEFSQAPFERTRDSSADSISNAFRVVFSEADFLPGLIVDRYNDVVTVQFLTGAMDQPEVRQAVVSALWEQLHPAGIVERTDPRVRELESMPARESGLLRGDKTQTVFALNGIRFHYDALAGQKTGAFLDQRENYAAAENYAHGDALDVFCYQGGFGLHLARSCRQVQAVDSSVPALDVAGQNQQLNPADGRAEVEWVEANAFDLLKEYATSGRQYDTIVLDPPAFAKSRRELPAALRGYKELNLRALKMLRPGGILVTCSCSFHVSEADFLDMLRSAAADVRRSPRLIEKRGQAQDHPVLLTVPETAYLKCVILQV
jgi:23S rRNA (cytosine1962-C5)-methyltransferase